jgi:membrane protein YqaA with SNARE-associated domain
MKLLRQAMAIPVGDWCSRESFLYLSAFLAAVAVIVAAALLHSHLSFSHLGYTGIAISALLASGGLVIPVPALAAACAASVFLVPILVAVIAGTSETVGELTGYFLGFSGRGFLTRGALYQKLEGWMRQRGWLVLFLLAVIPNPIFDVAGIAAGALRFPVWAFMGVVLAGKLIKFVAIVYACVYSIHWVTQLFT